MKTKVLSLSGWQDSGPEHWQGIWLAKYPEMIKVPQTDWHNAEKDEWVKNLNICIEEHSDSEIVLVGHSLACATFAHWSKTHASTSKAKIKGALFVCPSDVELPDFPKEISGFTPMPLEPLKFSTIVVTSSNDPYVSLERAEFFAKSWGAELVNIGPAGHINSGAGFGDWPEGEELLKKLL